ncbi:TIGR01777 family oxidoreductase [Pseudotenacibaculum haliotis]|uniref:TIGR01777 family oxidoreductase n=1 Tax=Pseudotenacibaculum haliotis TaxID=1862138 RepID=A0ABW5LQW7_9FLAO
MGKVLISGGSGLIGKRLSFLLRSKGYEVRILSRTHKNESEYPTYVWNIEKGTIDQAAFDQVDHIIHLSGSGIADKRWTEKRKQDIINSRVASTQLLLQNVKDLQIPLKTFISSSAIGYYGAVTSETIFDETSNPADDFLGKVCELWEQSVFQFTKENIRTVAIRTGIVLSKTGGALAKMKTPVISPLGSGKQYMPWIHIDDLCNIYIKAIEDEKMSGVYNGVAPEHQTNTSFSKILAKTVKRPFLPIGVPAFLLKMIFGEMAAILLEGSRVSSQKIQDTGFSFQFPDLSSALSDT